MLSDAIEQTLKIYRDSVAALDLQGEGNLNEFQFRWTGVFGLDWCLANESTRGGLPRGVIIEISGPENAGKSTIATLLAIATQGYTKRNQVLFLDYEHKYNITYAKEFGLDCSPEKFAFVKPKGSNPGESGMDLLERAVLDKDCGLCIVDSFAAILSKEECSGELTDANIGATARLQSKAIKNIVNVIQIYSPTVIMVNQVRETIGVMYGPSEKTSGARALKFYAAIRVRITQVKKYKDNHDNAVGARIKISVKKNQVSRNDVETELDIWFGVGPDNIGWVMDKADELEVIPKKGSKYTWDGKQYTISQLTDLMTDEKQLKQLYIACVQKNNQNVKDYHASLESRLGLKKKSQEAEPSPPENQ